MRGTHRHSWRCRAGPPGGRAPSRPATGGRREPQPPAIRPDRAGAGVTPQALALCDLVADPRSGITRVTVVGAPPQLVAAVREAAAGHGVSASGPPENGGDDRVTLQRPPRAGGEAGAGGAD
jgi:hypothetical protein